MYDDDRLTNSPELRELRDSLSGVATPGPPLLEAITARGRARRRQRLTNLMRLSLGAVAAATVLALGVSGTFSSAQRLGTIRTAAYTLSHDQNGTDKLTLHSVELLEPSQLQRDFAKYGIPAKVTVGSYCTSGPEPAGFAQAVRGPGPGSRTKGSAQQPSITIDPSQMPAGTELSVGDFPGAGQDGRQQEAYFSLINASSYTCTSTPPDMSKPDTNHGDLGLLYGGPHPSGS